MSNTLAREHWEWVQNLNPPCICTTCEVMSQLLELEAAAQRVRNVHRPYESYARGRETQACVTCIDLQGYPREYPCPTIEALEGDAK